VPGGPWRSGNAAEVFVGGVGFDAVGEEPGLYVERREKRRLEITRSLVTSPRLLLLDEPFSGIDPIAVYEVQKIVRRLRERALGILITDHNVRETLKLVDRAYLIHNGEVVYEGVAEQLVKIRRRGRSIWVRSSTCRRVA
jgi:lipopolysaccharide export system ATP-binding protein